MQAGPERRADQTGEEAAPGERVLLGQRELAQGVGTDQVLDRVVAEEGGEQGGDRRQVGGAFGHAGGHAVGGQPVEQIAGAATTSGRRS